MLRFIRTNFLISRPRFTPTRSFSEKELKTKAPALSFGQIVCLRRDIIE